MGLSVAQAKAIEQQYGISEKWILNGEKQKMVNPWDKLNLGDRWLLEATSPDSGPTYLKSDFTRFWAYLPENGEGAHGTSGGIF